MKLFVRSVSEKEKSFKTWILDGSIELVSDVFPEIDNPDFVNGKMVSINGRTEALLYGGMLQKGIWKFSGSDFSWCLS
jgi:hypothetical protein